MLNSTEDEVPPLTEEEEEERLELLEQGFASWTRLVWNRVVVWSGAGALMCHIDSPCADRHPMCDAPPRPAPPRPRCRRRDFNAFVRACEKHGRKAIPLIAVEVEGKTEAEVQQYAKVRALLCPLTPSLRSSSTPRCVRFCAP